MPDVDNPLPGLPRVPALGHVTHVAQHGGQVVVAHLRIVSIVSMVIIAIIVIIMTWSQENSQNSASSGSRLVWLRL